MIGWRPLVIVAAALMLHTKLSTCRAPGQGETGAPSQDTSVADVKLDQVDTSSLTAREKREWSTYVSELLAPCANQPVNIAQCVKEKRACPACLPAAKYLLAQVRLGRTRSQVESAFRTRFGADQVAQIEIGDSPTRGPANAPVTVVEFADFECPMCQAASPMIDKVLAGYPNRIRFVFKNYPLSIHENSEVAARASVAAGRQGKFWEMHDKLFSHGAPLDRQTVLHLASEIGLDPKKFEADLDSEAVADRVARDRKLGDSLDLTGTPTVYVDGRRFEVSSDFEQDLRDWIDLEFQILGKVAHPARPTPSSKASTPTPKASGAPPAAAKPPPVAATPPKPGSTTAAHPAKPTSPAAASAAKPAKAAAMASAVKPAKATAAASKD